MHIGTVNIMEMVIDRATTIIAFKQQVMYGLSIGIFRFDLDLKAKIKVMNIFTVNMLEIVRDRVKIQLPSNGKACKGFGLATLHLTYCKD